MTLPGQPPGARQCPTSHEVEPGECLSSIAYDHGHFPDHLWEHGENAELRRLRENPNLLAPGDVVHVPALRPKELTVKTGQRHVFRRKAVPEKLRFQLHSNDEERAGVQFILTIDGVETGGKTDAEGIAEVWIPPSARTATLTAGEQVIEIALGSLGPLSSEAGIKARLANLGFLDDPEGAGPDELEEAIGLFQSRHGIKLTGEADPEFLEKLAEEHTC